MIPEAAAEPVLGPRMVSYPDDPRQVVMGRFLGFFIEEIEAVIEGNLVGIAVDLQAVQESGRRS